MIVVDTTKTISEYLDSLPRSPKEKVILNYEWFLNYEYNEISLEDSKEFWRNKFEHDCESLIKDVRYIGRLSESVEIIIEDHPVNKKISQLYQNCIGDLVTFEGVIRKSSETKQEVSACKFKCGSCGGITERTKLDSFDLKAPIGLTCPIQAAHRKLIPIIDESATFIDTQYVTIQENQGEHGRQPRSILCYLKGSLVDSVQAGLRCKMTGIVRVLQTNNQDKRLSLYVDVYGITKDEDDYTDVSLSDDDIRTIKGISELNDIYLRLANSIAPTVYGYEMIKLAIVLQMFGGTTIDTGNTYLRGVSHILLCGDPGLAKSQIIRAVSNLVPRSVYTSGKSSSAAGLTAAAVKDETDGRWVLEAGALVLADGGMCIVDELDKMTDEDRSALHEAMESQTISVNKAGISAQLFTRCSLLAAANPKMGKFITGMDIASQVNLPPALLSRFDLIFLMMDVPDEKMDSYVANFVLNTRRLGEIAMSNSSDESGKPGETFVPQISEDLFRKYIIYSRQINPVLSKEVMDHLTKKYVQLRRLPDTISMTVRQLEALIRLCESSARVRLSSEITMDDADRVLALYESASKSISLNTTSDVTTFENKSNNIDPAHLKYILDMLKMNNNHMTRTELYSVVLADQVMDEITLDSVIRGMMCDDYIKCVGQEIFIECG